MDGNLCRASLANLSQMSMNNSFLSRQRWTPGDTKEKVEIKPAILAKEVRGKVEEA